MERFNGTVRDSEKTFRGLSNTDTAVFKGMKVHYNRVRKHNAIKNKTLHRGRRHLNGGTQQVENDHPELQFVLDRD